MRVYEVTVIDRVASREGEEDVKYDSFVAVGTKEEVGKAHNEGEANKALPDWFFDEDIHYYFTEDEWKEGLQDDGTIETDEFAYWVKGEVE